MTHHVIRILKTWSNMSTAKVAPRYIVAQNTTTPKAHMIVAIRVAYGMRVRHASHPPVTKKLTTK